jgi:menaquinone-specific isochorismate synthase
MKAVPDIAVDRSAASGEVAAFSVDAVDAELEAGLATARRVHGWTYVALPAPVVAAPAVVAAAKSAAIVAWSSQSMTLVGIGVARELRGNGASRWRDVIAAAHGLGDGVVVGGAGRESLVKPRLLGGVAFAPGAAEAAPWTGFGDAWFMLPRWTYVHDGSRGALVLAVDARDAQHGSRWHAELATLRAALTAPFAQRPQPPMTSIDPGDRDAWRMQVRAITDAIADGECAKVVSARSAVVTLAGEARAADMLAELDARHPECVRVVVRPPEGGTFIAATPERLVRRDGATVACDALAGSVARGAAFTDDAPGRSPTGADDRATELLASGKDRREHDLVVSAIGTALRELGADVRVPTEPTIRTLRHVLHLHTPIAATLREPHHVLELAAALHPTPAVGGTPTRIATEWIAARESVPRGWYASPVGWFDLDGNGELAVAIRSGLVTGDRAHLWAGAGIVAGSDPDRELAETDLKLRAILGALGVSA